MAKSPSKPVSKAGGGCLMLFALPFAGFGLFMAGMVARDYYTWASVQDWQPTEATLLHAELKTSRGSEGGSTYRAVARYRYTVAGKPYESDRVAVHKGADNIGPYNRDRGRELQRLHKARRPITAFVDPDDPTQAILYRDLRPGYMAFKSMFALIFGGVGFGLLYGGIWSMGDARRTSAFQQQYPEEPWKWKEAWRTGRLKSSGAAAWAVGIFAALWNLISWPAFIGVMLQQRLEFGPILLILLFPIIGVLMGAWASYLILRRLKWGVSEFEMATIPGVIGGPLAGVIRTPRKVDAESGVVIRLACIETVRERSGGESSSRDLTRWSGEKTIVRDLHAGDRTLIPVQFMIPYGLPSCAVDDIKWKLTAEAKTGGVDFHTEFEVPVFETSASSPTPPRDVEDCSLYAPPLEISALVSRLGARLEDDFPDRRTVYFPMARNRGLAIGLSLGAVVCIVITAAMYLSPLGWFAILMALFSLLMIVLAIRVVFERTRLEFGRRGVAYQRSVLRAGDRREFAAEAIHAIEVDKSGTEVNGAPYWNVVLRAADGDCHKLATELRDRSVADQFAAEIARFTGLSDSRSSGEASRIQLDAKLPAELRNE